MNIAFLSYLNFSNQNNYSSAFYSIYSSLRNKNKIDWIGEAVFSNIQAFHKANFSNSKPFIPENYAMLFGKAVTDLLKRKYYDVLICRDYFFAAYLVSDIPLVFVDDNSFHCSNQYTNSDKQELIELTKQLKLLAMQKIDKIIDCSEYNMKQNDYNERYEWNGWLEKTNQMIEKVISNQQPDFYVPVYVINIREREDRKQHIIREFQNRKEFELNFIEASVHPIGAIGLWNSMIRVIKTAQAKEDDIIIICEDDHYFTENYSPNLLFKEITEAYEQGAEVLSGGIGGFGRAIPVGRCRYKVDWFWSTQFIVIFSSFFDKMLNYSFKDTDTADGVISQLAINKMVIHPFISEQKDFGYSDVTRSNMEQKGLIRELFLKSSARIEYINKHT